jgi:hypothetical protein
MLQSTNVRNVFSIIVTNMVKTMGTRLFDQRNRTDVNLTMSHPESQNSRTKLNLVLSLVHNCEGSSNSIIFAYLEAERETWR